MFGEGISMVGDILDLAASCDVVAKSGAWYAYEGNKIGQGRENAKQYLKTIPPSAMRLPRRSRSLRTKGRCHCRSREGRVDPCW